MRGEQYLSAPAHFSAVYRGGASWRSELVIMRTLSNGLDRTRYGFSVSRRVGKAVERNRVKRRFREIMRQAPLKAGWDIVLIARPPIKEVDYFTLNQNVIRLLKKAGLLVREHEEVSPGID